MARPAGRGGQRESLARRLCSRCDVLVGAEHVRRVIDMLDRGKTGVVLAVRGTDAVGSLVSEVVDVDLGKVRLHGFEQGPGPRDVVVGLCWIVPPGQDQPSWPTHIEAAVESSSGAAFTNSS